MSAKKTTDYIRESLVPPKYSGTVPLKLGHARWTVGVHDRVRYVRDRVGGPAAYVLTSSGELHVLVAKQDVVHELQLPRGIQREILRHAFGVKS